MSRGRRRQDFHFLLKAIESFDMEKTNEELSRLALLLSPAAFVYKVVLPVMQMAGDHWEDGTFPLAREHMLSACARNLMGGWCDCINHPRVRPGY